MDGGLFEGRRRVIVKGNAAQLGAGKDILFGWIIPPTPRPLSSTAKEMMNRWLDMGRLALLAIAVACAPVTAQQTTAPTPSQPAAAVRPADVASPEAIVTALYDVISGPASQPRDWDRFRSLFLGGAQLAFVQTSPSGQKQLYNLPVEDFIRLAGPGYTSGTGFWEQELGHRVDRYGSIAHVFSAYESRVAGPNAPVAERGINSVQLIQHQDRWWITNLVFDGETPANPIPAEYASPQHE